MVTNNDFIQVGVTSQKNMIIEAAAKSFCVFLMLYQIAKGA